MRPTVTVLLAANAVFLAGILSLLLAHGPQFGALAGQQLSTQDVLEPPPTRRPHSEMEPSRPAWWMGPGYDIWARYPSMALVVRTHAGAANDLTGFLLPSIRAFWPWEFCPVVLVLDDEKPADHELGWRLAMLDPWIQLSYQALPASVAPDAKRAPIFPASFGGEHGKDNGYIGYDRQQYDTFFMDLHSDAAVLAIFDSDAALSGTVTPAALFADGGAASDGGLRIRVKGTQKWEVRDGALGRRAGEGEGVRAVRYPGSLPDCSSLPVAPLRHTVSPSAPLCCPMPRVSQWHQNITEWAIGAPQPADFMCHFPVVVWRCVGGRQSRG